MEESPGAMPRPSAIKRVVPVMAGMRNLQDYLGLLPRQSTTSAQSEAMQPTGHQQQDELSRSPVMICIDLEAYEHANEKITEVGVAILDTLDVQGMSTDNDVCQWLCKIRSRHFLIKEYLNLVNKRFVKGCPDKFNFGQSEVVALRDIASVLGSIFASPSTLQHLSENSPSLPQTHTQREIVLVGHSLSNDLQMLQHIRFDALAQSPLISRLDTATLSRVSKHHTVSLSKLLTAVSIPASNLHNAGNDATYTLQALLAMALLQTKQPGQLHGRITTLFPPVDAKQEEKLRAMRLAKEERRAAKRERRKAQLLEKAALAEAQSVGGNATIVQSVGSAGTDRSSAGG